MGRTGVRVYMMRRERLEVSGECRAGGRSGHDGECTKNQEAARTHICMRKYWVLTRYSIPA